MQPSLKDIQDRFRTNETTCERLVGIFSLLSNKSRLRIVCMLMDGEFCVSDIVETVKPGKLTNISQQLRILTLADILEKRRSEQKILYRLKDPNMKDLLKFLEKRYLKEAAIP